MKGKTIEEIKNHLDLYEHYYPEIVVLCRSVAEYYWLKNDWEINYMSHESYILECLDNQEEIVFFYDEAYDAAEKAFSDPDVMEVRLNIWEDGEIEDTPLRMVREDGNIRHYKGETVLWL